MKQQNKKMDELLTILDDGKELNLNLQDALTKVQQVQETLSSDTLKVVMLSSFSDGKTTIVAGLNGRVEDNMKIDIDESSDEITIYHPQGLANGFEIIDTPGLFGTKTKEVDGKNIRFSEQTEKYISEAHIVLYICDAVNPLKDSHAFFIEKVMRQFGKLDSTIFVINKIDETGYDISDKEDFDTVATIKTENLIGRLKDTIGLTAEEQQKLHIVCVAADPYGEGMSYWLDPENRNEYKQLSHIEDLRCCINQVFAATNPLELRRSVELATIKDIIGIILGSVQQYSHSVSAAADKLRETQHDNEQDLNILKQELEHANKEMSDRLNALKDTVLLDIGNTTLDTIEEVLNSKIGVQGDKITFYVFNNEVNQIVRECTVANGAALETHIVTIEKNTSGAEAIATEALKKGAGSLKNIHISGDMVKTVRDFAFKSYKFKPWEAIKWGKKLTKVSKGVAIAIEAAVAGYQRYKTKKANKNLEKSKEELKKVINDAIADIFATFNSKEKYYKNYAPQYLELKKNLEERKQEYSKLQQYSNKLTVYQQRLIDWMKSNAEDVSYAENQQ